MMRNVLLILNALALLPFLLLITLLVSVVFQEGGASTAPGERTISFLSSLTITSLGMVEIALPLFLGILLTATLRQFSRLASTLRLRAVQLGNLLGILLIMGFAISQLPQSVPGWDQPVSCQIPTVVGTDGPMVLFAGIDFVPFAGMLAAPFFFTLLLLANLVILWKHPVPPSAPGAPL